MTIENDLGSLIKLIVLGCKCL